MAHRTILCILILLFTIPINPSLAQRNSATGQSGTTPPFGQPDQIDTQHGNNEAELLQQMIEIESELTRRKADHRLLMTDLEALLATAKNEKAKQTQQKINDLIKKRERQHTEQTRHLEQKLQRLKRSVADRAKRGQAQLRVGTVAPKFSLNTFNGGKNNLSDYKNKVVVLEWLNPECPISTYYHKNKTIKALADKYTQQGVAWLSVNSTLSQDNALTSEFIKTYNITHPVLNDANGQVARLYYVQRTPQIVIIDKKGKIVYSGAIDNALPKPKDGKVVAFVDKALTEILAGRSVTLSSTTPTAGTPVNAGILRP